MAALDRYGSHGTEPGRARWRRESAAAFLRVCTETSLAVGIRFGFGSDATDNEVFVHNLGQIRMATPMPLLSELALEQEWPAEIDWTARARLEIATHGTNALRRLCEDAVNPRSPMVVAVGNLRGEGSGCEQRVLLDVDDGPFEIARKPTHVARLCLSFDGEWMGCLDVRPINRAWTDADGFRWLDHRMDFEDLA